jgi:hypothetical protein
MRRLITTLLTFSLIWLAAVPAGNGCTRSRPFTFGELFEAQVIVVATPRSYVGDKEPTYNTTDVPDASIVFDVDETLRGTNVATTVEVGGYLVDTDDFNDSAVPYMFVRPGGRQGSCYATSYRRDQPHLLFLKYDDGALTPYWSGLGPTNEQLRSRDDAWVRWVRRYVAGTGHASPAPAN